MRPPSILDVVHAVKQTAPAHAGVGAWWYAPPLRLRLSGDRAEEARAGVEIVLEVRPGARADQERIASELARALHLASVVVRTYEHARESHRLFRIFSAPSAAGGRSDDGRDG